MELTEMEYENFGRCVRIENGRIDCVVTIEEGPRMLRFGFIGEKNIFFTDPERKYKRSNSGSAAALEKNAFYYLYGGHRLQLCQTPQVDFADNSPVVYSVSGEGVTFIPPKLKQEEIQLSYEIIMGEKAHDIMVVHTAKNCSKEQMVFALLPATAVEGGGVAVIPQSQQEHPGRPDRTLNLWPNTDIGDARFFYGNRFLAVRQEPGNEKPLRIGTNNFPGWIAYAGKGFTLVKRFVATPQAAYPDSGSSSEIHLTSDFAELCTVSPMYQVEPGETVKHVENLFISHAGEPPVFSNENGIAEWANTILE